MLTAVVRRRTIIGGDMLERYETIEFECDELENILRANSPDDRSAVTTVFIREENND